MTERTVPGIEEHPDVLALRRSSSERAASTSTVQFLEGLGLLVGLFLATSAWMVGFNATLPGLTVINLIAGLAYAYCMGSGLGPAFQRTHAMSWAASAIGVFTILAPFIVTGARESHPASVIVTNVVAGGVAFACALTMGLIGVLADRKT